MALTVSITLATPSRPATEDHARLRIGKGIRKVKLTPGKYHFLANRTGVVVPAYDKDGKLRTIDVRESVQIGEVGLREGGHVAKKDADGRTSALEIEDATVDSVGRPFTVRTTGTVTVRETIYGEVLAGNLNAQMINADGKIVAAHDTIRAVGPVQNSILRAPNISVGKSGKQGTVINSTFHARRNFTAANIRFLGHCQVVLGSDLVCANDEVVCGEDLFANRQHLLTVERTLQGQVEELDRNINEDLYDWPTSRKTVKEQVTGQPSTKSRKGCRLSPSVHRKTMNNCSASSRGPSSTWGRELQSLFKTSGVQKTTPGRTEDRSRPACGNFPPSGNRIKRC